MEKSMDQGKDTFDASALDGWTKEEKFYLLQALKSTGSRDIEAIEDYVTTKSTEQIIAAVGYYKQKAAKHPRFQKKVKAKLEEEKKCSNRTPLASWANLLTDNRSFNDLRTETSTAIEMIAELEDIPDGVITEGVDFRNVYQQIANAMNGKPIEHNDFTNAVLHKCIVETALSSKVFIKPSAHRFLLNSIDMSNTDNNKDITAFPNPTQSQELTILRHLISQRRYNPLNIPEKFLRPTSEPKHE